jgi:hypothetical protein
MVAPMSEPKPDTLSACREFLNRRTIIVIGELGSEVKALALFVEEREAALREQNAGLKEDLAFCHTVGPQMVRQLQAKIKELGGEMSEPLRLPDGFYRGSKRAEVLEVELSEARSQAASDRDDRLLWEQTAHAAEQREAALRSEVERLKEVVDYVRNRRHECDARPCPLCVYESGVFLKSCTFHALADELRKRAEQADARLARVEQAARDVLLRFGTIDWSSVHDQGALDALQGALSGEPQP